MALLTSESTSFTLDNMGRYLCNTLPEAVESAQQTVGGRRRDFDVIVVGGGTFGAVIAQALLATDASHTRRILVLEAGPFVLPEHVQNLPLMGGTPDFRRPWVSQAGFGFPGLLYAVGGRSLAWGGWSPELLHDTHNDEMRQWPPTVIAELQGQYFREASDQIGVTATNDFIFGPLHEALRRQLLDGLTLGAKPGGPFAALPVDDLPDHPIVRAYVQDHNGSAPPDGQLRQWLNLPRHDATPRRDLLRLLKLEAPLAVQASTLPGLFPFNKFSAVPILTRAARIAATEADGVGPHADARKRLMVVPKCHVQDIITQTQADHWVRVTGVRVLAADGASHELMLVPPQANGRQGVVIIALGTVESTRLALATFQDSLAGRAAGRMGGNLIAHLRSNLTIRIPRSALTSLPPAALQSLQVSALFVKGKAKIGGVDRYFHVQVTASGLNALGSDSEAELFKKIPDYDQVESMLAANDSTVVVTLRGIGEMTPGNPESRVELAKFDADFQRPAAFVTIGDAKAPAGGGPETQADRELWGKMDDLCDELAIVFANGQPFEILADKLGKTIAVPAGASAQTVKALLGHPDRRDGLGTTHHEAGTLRMSLQAADGVTNEFGRVHDTTNCYVVGPALLPSTGSPNPMLTGVALARRTGDLLTGHVLPAPAPVVSVSGFTPLFDGTGRTFSRWTRVSPGVSCGFALMGGEIVTYGAGEFGLLYYAAQAFADFTLRVQFRVFDLGHNSGVFVRFRDPLLDPTPSILQRIQADGDDFGRNRGLTAVHSGFEVQIDDRARGDSRKDFYGIRPEPDGLRKNRTGAIYKIPARDFIPHLNQFDAELQTYTPAPNLVPGVWYEYEIQVIGNDYTVDLTNLATSERVRTTHFTSTDGLRGVAVVNGQPAGFVGLQSYPGSPVAFRNVLVK